MDEQTRFEHWRKQLADAREADMRLEMHCQSVAYESPVMPDDDTVEVVRG